MPNPLAFVDYAALTRDHALYPKDKIVNAAQRFRTYLLGEMLAVKDVNQVVRSMKSGQSITERVRMSNLGNFEEYTPGGTLTATRSSTSKTLTWVLRPGRNPISYTDYELLTTEGASDADIYKRFLEWLKSEGGTEHMDGLENALFDKPEQTTMEVTTADPGKPYSIPAYVTENTGGSNIYRAPGWGSGTLAGVNPTTSDNWRSQIRRYNDATPSAALDGLFAAFDLMMLDVQFRAPKGSFAKYYEDKTTRAMKIVTNLTGSAMVQRLLRESNDFTRQGPQDGAYAMPQWNGVPIYYSGALDSALLQETTGVYANTAYTASKPRFFFLNLQDLFPVFHAERFMYTSDVYPPDQSHPDSYLMLFVSWRNLVCVNRRTQGIVAPTSDA